jgi:tape measure domain-containing protein
MAGNEWVIKVTADVKDVLDASRKIGQAGKDAGQEFQQGFAANDKILERMRNQLKELKQDVGSNVTTLGGLKAKLGELGQTLDKAAIGSKEFAAAQKEIAKTQQEINTALKGFSAGEGTINGLRNKMTALNETLNQTVIGSNKFIEAQKEIAQTQEKINTALRGFGGSETTISGLRNKIGALSETLDQTVIGSEKFIATQKEIAQTQEKLNTALKGFQGNEKSIEGLNNKLAEYNKALQKAEVGSKEFVAAQKGVAKTQQEINTALKGFDGNEKSIRGSRERLSELNQTLEKTAIGSREFKQAQRELAAAQRDVDKALGQTSMAAKALGGVLSGLGALGVGFSVVGFLKGSVEKAMELETITRKLSNTLGAQGAAGALSFVRETADTLGLSFKDLANSFGSFTAAATSAGVPLKQQKDLFAAVAKAGQALGLSNDEISGSLLALQQTASKGTVSMEELRGQLGERLPIALAATAKGLGVSQQELIKLVESGKLTSNEFFPAITKGLNELTSAAGGVPTAAQNLAKFQNTLDDLQASSGTSLLPIVSGAIRRLSQTLEEFKAVSAGFQLNVAFGLAGDEAIQLAGYLKEVQNRYQLTSDQARRLLSNAIASSGAVRNSFGVLNTEGEKFAKIQTGLDEEAKKFVKTHVDAQGIIIETGIAEKARIEEAKKLNIEKTKELTTQGQLAEAQQKALKAQIDGQVAAQQANINLGQALVSLEDSRFSIVRNRNSFELKDAQERKASEAELDVIKRRGEAIELAALNSKYQALLQQQALQRDLVSLQQQQAAVEANQAAGVAKLELKKAELKLSEAQLSNNKEATAKAQNDVEIAQLNLDIANSKLQILSQTQPIEERIAKANNETARNGMIAEAASKGLALAADGTFKAAKGTADQFKSLGDSLKVPLSQQGAFAQLAADVGLKVKDTGKGYYEIGQALGKTASPAANNIRDYMSVAAKATGVAKTQASGLAGNMSNAANAANAFYRSLAAASGLPPARFTGGPVDAGQTYRVNDGPSGMSLGQEAFLSASGALSLINRPMNSLWTAPSRGTVIPASITSRLKDSGALEGGAGVLRGGFDPAVAQLSLAVGNLSQEVAELRRKAWNVSVGVRGDGSGLRLAQTMARMR